MDKSNPFKGLRFERQPTIPRKPLVIGALVAAVGAVCLLVPQAVLIWVVLPFVAAILWVASFGWRHALAELQTLLRRLEHV
jgi:hypothetical protein